MADEPDDAPGEQECLLCFLERMLDRHGCDGSLRWTSRWREVNAPWASHLERTMRTRSGFCDCEVTANVFAAEPAIAGLPN